MKRLLTLLLGLGILALMYWRIHPARLLEVFRTCRADWLLAALLMFIPTSMLTAWRLQLLAPDEAHISFREALRLFFASATLNIVLPSKLGDLGKALFIADKGHISGSRAFSLVVYEKACDLLGLLGWCAMALAVYPHKDRLLWLALAATGGAVLAGILLLANNVLAALVLRKAERWSPAFMKKYPRRFAEAWLAMSDYVRHNRPLAAGVFTLSLLTSLLHLFQIWFCIFALNAAVPFLTHAALTSLAVLVGLAPVTFAGIGTRDAALVYLYRPYLAAPVAAALGLLCTARYILPALCGLPFLSGYLLKLRTLRSNPGPA